MEYIIANMESIMLNYFDFFVIIVTLGLAVSGFLEGFVRGVMKLAGFIAVIVLMALFSDVIVDIVVLTVKLPPKIAIPLVFIVIFTVATIAVHFIAEILHKLIKFTPIRFIDSGLGSIFGILKALFINGILAMLLSFTSPGTFLNNQYSSSYTGKTLNDFLYWTIPIMKSAVVHMYRKYIPVPKEQEKKEDEKIIPPEVI